MQADTLSSSYGKCRCCLAKGNHQPIYGDSYSAMFRDCLNLFLATDPRLTRLMCSACETFLRDVTRFRQIVVSAERELLKAISNENIFVNVPAVRSSQNEVKEEINTVKTETNVDQNSTFMCSDNVEPDTKDDTELKTEVELNEGYFSDMEAFEDDAEIKSENEETIASILRKNINISIRKPRKIIKEGKIKAKKKRKKYESESDTPISEIKQRKAKMKKYRENTDAVIELKKEASNTHTKGESLKDNNKIRSNIILILKNSTVIPFRNNFRSIFKCFYCEKPYILFNELKEHVEIDHIDVSETTIDKSLRTLQDLILSADISSIKCRLCHEEIKTIDNVIEHLTSTHRKIYYDTVRKPSHGILGFDLSADSLKCHVCSKDFAFFKNLSIHMNEHYGLFVCYVCGKKFLSEHRYKCHVFNHHESKETKCKYCSVVFKTEASMAYHIKKEHLKRTIKCPKCPETFPFTQYMKRVNHMDLVHGIKKPVFKCDTCGKEYANSGSLAAHKRYTHKRTKEHRCDICGYITVHSTVMKNHMDVHNGVKNYECEFCKKKFAKPYTLKLHLKIHLNDKRFVCTLCEAAFIQKNSLKNHVKARHPDCGIDLSKI